MILCIMRTPDGLALPRRREAELTNGATPISRSSHREHPQYILHWRPADRAGRAVVEQVISALHARALVTTTIHDGVHAALTAERAQAFWRGCATGWMGWMG